LQTPTNLDVLDVFKNVKTTIWALKKTLRGHGRKLGAEFEGTEKNLRIKFSIFERIFLEKIPSLTPKISDDLILVINSSLSVIYLSLLSEI